MMDIVGVGQGEGQDLRLYDAQSPKGANVLSVQLGALEWWPDFGIDLEFFIQEGFSFQNESFKSYLIQRLTESHVNVISVRDVLTTFVQNLTFEVGNSEQSSEGFIR